MRRLALLALLAVLVAGCGGGDDDGLVFEDPRGTVTVERGMKFTFQFSVNAGVGFDWEPVATPPEGSLAKLTETDVHYENPDSAGDSGVKRFRFEAGERAGRQKLVFRHLYRGDQKERRTITLEVR